LSSSITSRWPRFAALESDVHRADAPCPDVPANEASDEKLIGGICQGDTSALATLFRRRADEVRHVAYRVLQDASEADDVLQDVFLLIYRKAALFDRSKSPAHFWIMRMTYHCAISRRRYLDSRHFYTRLDLDDVESDFTALHASSECYEESVEAVLGNGALEKMFQALSQNQRQTLRLFFQEGHTLDEIATELGQSRDNVRHHYFRGLEKLRKQIFGGNSRTK
jgi:RNA polymerase sigma-70 factor (ECF subfamily)